MAKTPSSQRSFQDQVDEIVQLVTFLPAAQATPKALGELLALCVAIPVQFFPSDFPELLHKVFGTPLAELKKAFNTHQKRSTHVDDFEALVPQSGWLYDYIQYTRETEPPTAFHFFSAVCVLGATIGRRIYFPRGNGDLFPNVNVVLVAPAGRCKKTTACNLAVNLFRRIGGNILADKVTPEAIIESFKATTTATGLIYAPEWAVFLGKQQYMEGLVPMLTALFDCPASWSSSTIMRSTTQLQNVALSHLAATTIDWMQTSITKDAFSGGFMSRLLFIVQHDTSRSYALPPPLDAKLAKRLTDGLLQLQQVTGMVTLSIEGEKWYTKWYDARKMTTVERQLAGYFERKPDRLLQIAIVLNAAQNPRNLILDTPVLAQAEKLLTWIERLLPGAFDELSATITGDEQHRLLKQIRAANGELGHTEWLRKNTSRMNADTFRKYIETLKQAGLLAKDMAHNKYYLLPAGWQENP